MRYKFKYDQTLIIFIPQYIFVKIVRLIVIQICATNYKCEHANHSTPFIKIYADSKAIGLMFYEYDHENEEKSGLETLRYSVRPL